MHITQSISVVVLMCCMLNIANGQFYTSSFEIESLLNLESKILDSLNEYVERLQKHGVSVDETFLSFLESTNVKNRETNRNHDLDNPLSSFHIVKRWVHQWVVVHKNLTCIEEDDLIPGEEKCPVLTGADIINNAMKREGARWPTDLDLQLAAGAIINFWNVYNLDVSDVAKGKLSATKEQPLSTDELFFLADNAMSSGKFYEAITWFEYLRMHLDEFESYEFKKSTLIRRLASCYYSFKMTSKSVEILERYLEEDADDKGVSRDLVYYRKNGNNDEYTSVERFHANDTSKKTQSRNIYESLCRQVDNPPSSLKCELLPLFRSYGYSKMELLSKRPRIEILYDVINTEAAETIRKYGEKDFTRFAEMLPYKDGFVDTTLRSSPLCEGNRRTPLLKNITRRLEQVTKFMMYPAAGVSSTECYTVVNEGLGTVTRPQVFFWPVGHEPFPGAGNRLATIMLQLSDVKLGGAIVFPRIGITIPVVKNSAVVWWNLKPNGLPDRRSLHINCPVVVGSRWIVYKPVLSTNQVFRRPCEL